MSRQGGTGGWLVGSGGGQAHERRHTAHIYVLSAQQEVRTMPDRYKQPKEYWQLQVHARMGCQCNHCHAAVSKTLDILLAEMYRLEYALTTGTPYERPPDMHSHIRGYSMC